MKKNSPENDLNLKEIHPKNAEKYSPNLYKYLKNKKVAQKLATAFMDKEGIMWLGYYFDGDFIGVRMSLVLCFGANAQAGCYGKQLGKLKEVKNFWKKYLKIGRCAIDPAHNTIFQGDDTRWILAGRTRHCQWCNNHAQKQKKVVYRTIRQEWVPIPAMATA